MNCPSTVFRNIISLDVGVLDFKDSMQFSVIGGKFNFQWDLDMRS